MEKNKLFTGFCLFMLLVMVAFVACQEEETWPRTRLFSPVLNVDLLSEENTIIVNMGKMKGAVSYTIEVSRDTFKTIDYTIQADTNYLIINKALAGEELLWYTLYQVRATAHADDPEFDSKVSDLGSVRTQKFPSNMKTPTSFDILDTQAKVNWTTTGDPITTVKVFAGTDLRLVTPLLTITVSPSDQVAAMKIVSGMKPSTTYQIAIYSGNTIRGWEVYKTRAGLVLGTNVFNLAGIEKTTILADTLPDVPNGSIILLEGGRTYSTGGYKFDKSVKIMAGYSFVPALPKIDCAVNFNVLGGSNVDSIVFREIAFSADFAASYVFNPNEAAALTIGHIKFENCQIRKLRGIIRFRGPKPGNIAKYSIINCIVDSIGGYGLFTMDTNGGIAIGDILLKNSSFSKCDYFMQTYTQSSSLNIEDCTFSEVPSTGAILFRWRGAAGNADITNGLSMKNCIMGHAWDKAASGGYTFNADAGNGGSSPSLDATTISIVNCYSVSQFAFATGRELAGFPVGNYKNKAADLWVSPYSGLNFNFKDSSFAGKSDCGDPRWRK
jgi:hypothetical protein